MKKIAVVILVLLVNVYPCVKAAAFSVSGSVDYEYTKQSGQEEEMTPNASIYIEDDINRHVSFNGSFAASQVNTQPVYSAINDSYLTLKNGKMSYLVGPQSYTLGDGFVASMSGISGVRTIFDNGGKNATVFYSKKDSGIFAADFTVSNFSNCKDLTLETSYFKTDEAFADIKVSKLVKNVLCSGQLVENLNTKATGYELTSQYGNAQKKGDADISLSYRNVEPGAVSEYSGDTNFDNSVGVRVGVDYKITDTLTFSAFHDFSRTQDNIDKNETNIQLDRNF